MPAPNDVEHPDNVAVDDQVRQPPPTVEEASDEQGTPSDARKRRLAKRTIAAHADSSAVQHKLNENITPEQRPSTPGSIGVSLYFSIGVTRYDRLTQAYFLCYISKGISKSDMI